ncbi:MAG: ferrochelatase [Candidatus Obscuribacter sp.]|nr:ferrochelatase [Candidatus Obscuribacter sp.]
MTAKSKYDAILFLSFGGPEGMADVMPFLENVLRGKNVPEARMKEVAHHYELFGGVSPINAQNRNLIKGLEAELKKRDIALPIYFGNRNWHPMLADTLKEMAGKGVKNVLTFVTSAYSSYSGCRQYLQDIEKALQEAQVDLNIDKLRIFYNHPLFIDANVDCVKEGLAHFTPEQLKSVYIAFTAHSIPTAMASTSDYAGQLQKTCDLVAQAVGLSSYKLVYQSRSGPPTQPWLEPDILDHIKNLKQQGVSNILVHPIGFVSDHMEVIYDLDHEAKQLADELSIDMVRTKSSGNSPKFAELMGALVQERLQSEMDASTEKPCAFGTPLPDVCAPDCCAYTPMRPPQAATQK